MDEDGVDVVEAIDAWIDEQIDDLSDDDLERILEIVDVVAASHFVDLDADDVCDEDIDELVDLAGGSDEDRAHTESVLRSALLPAQEDDDDSVVDTTFAADDGPDLDDQPQPEDQPANATQDPDDEAEDSIFNSDDGFLDDLALAEEANRLDEVEDPGHAGFLSDLANATTPAPASAADLPDRDIPEIEFRDFDELGPSFLPESVEPPRRSGGTRHFLLPVLMILGLAAFAFGMLQLVDSLDADEPGVTSSDVQEAPTAEPTAVALATAEPTADVPAAPIDPSAPTATPTPEPTPPSRIGVRLVNGDVMLVTYDQVGVPPTFSKLYDASDEGLAPAREIAWLTAGLGVVNADGDVLTVDPDARRPEPTVIYEASGGIEEAVEIASVPGQVAVLTKSGDINLITDNERADPNIINKVWDAEEQGARATDLSSIGELVPFVLDDGTARMIVTSSDNLIITIWLAGEQPPAFNIAGSPTGILLGVGQGAVARYRIGDVEGDRLEAVWDPFSTDEQPAIGYSSAGDRTAVVLGDGAIVLADDTGTGARIWDPSETELLALVAVADDSQIVVLLETGSVVRIPLDPNQLIESIWDITDETLSPANQLAVEPANR